MFVIFVLRSFTGAMTGGGTKPIKGRMSSKLQSDFTPEQLNSLRTKLESQEASYEVITELYPIVL